MGEFKAIETQEDFDKAIQKRLEQKDREAAEKYKDYMSPDDVAKLNADHEKAISDLQGKLAQADEKAAQHDKVVQELQEKALKAETSLLKSQVAHENGVPIELADRLIGSTAEELKADAERFAGFMAPKTAAPLRTTDPSNVLTLTGNPDTDSKNAAAAAMLSFLPQLTPNN